MAKSKTKIIDPLPVYVIAGKDHHLIDEKLNSILDQIIPHDERDMGLITLDADKAEISDVLDEVRTLPFLASRRVAVLKNADKFISEHKEILEKYFNSPSQCGSLIFTVSTWRKNTRIAKQLAKTDSVIEIKELKNYQLPSYIADYIKVAHKKTIDKKTAEYFVEMVGDDTGRLCAEADKLALYVNDQKNISINHIAELIGKNRVFDAFAVIDALSTPAGSAIAIDKMRSMFSADKSAEYSVVGAFAYHFRRIFQARVLFDQGKNPYQIIQILRIWHDKEGFTKQVTKLNLRQLGSILSQLAIIDYESKTGQCTISTSIEIFLTKIGLFLNR